MYVGIHICMLVCTSIYTDMDIYVGMHVCVWWHACVYQYTCVYVGMHVCLYQYTYMSICMCKSTCMCPCMHVCTCCKHVCTYLSRNKCIQMHAIHALRHVLIYRYIQLWIMYVIAILQVPLGMHICMVCTHYNQSPYAHNLHIHVRIFISMHFSQHMALLL